VREIDTRSRGHGCGGCDRRCRPIRGRVTVEEGVAPSCQLRLQNRAGMVSDCRTPDTEDAVIGFSDKDAGVRVVIGNDATLDEHVGPGDIRRIAAVHVILHLSAGTAARFRSERLTVDIGGGGAPELVIHLVAAGGAIYVRDVGALVVIAGVSVSAARTILAIYVVIAALAREAVGVPKSIRIG